MQKDPVKKIKVLIAFDFGLKRIGVAVGQTITQTARALETIPAKNGEIDWQLVTTLIKKWRPDAFVVGIPLNMDGTEQPITLKAKQFAHTLQTRFGIHTFFDR